MKCVENIILMFSSLLLESLRHILCYCSPNCPSRAALSQAVQDCGRTGQRPSVPVHHCELFFFFFDTLNTWETFLRFKRALLALFHSISNLHLTSNQVYLIKFLFSVFCLSALFSAFYWLHVSVSCIFPFCLPPSVSLSVSELLFLLRITLYRWFLLSPPWHSPV